MRVYARYGNDEISLGEMAMLPDHNDRVKFYVPKNLRQDNEVEYLTVHRRLFEPRPFPLTEDHVLLDIPPRTEWICVLIFQETR